MVDFRKLLREQHVRDNMTMKLIFDTETNGLADVTRPLDQQPRLLQLAAVLVDEQWKERACLSVIVNIDSDIVIPDSALNVHGIGHAQCEKYGVPLLVACAAFNNIAKRADEAIAYNISFDMLVLRGEFSRLQKPCELDTLVPRCAMLAAQNSMGLRRWPKLSAAYEHFIGEKFEDAHDALNDVRATVKVLQAIEARANSAQAAGR